MNLTALRKALAAIILGMALPATAALVAGIQTLNIPGQGSLPPLTGALWYPCAKAPSPTQFGPFVLIATKDCPIDGKNRPLIVVSHGRAGSFMGHRDTALALADAGFLVATISHPGDNAQDSSRTDDLSAFVERPADIRRLPDYLLGTWSHASAIKPEFHTVANARHFAFLPPCPLTMVNRMDELCTDPEGFDRAEFHRQFDATVVEFFRHALPRD